MAGPGSTLMIKESQSQIHPAAGAEYYANITQTFAGAGVAYILPYHEIVWMKFIVNAKNFLEVTIDDPAMVVLETANWERWNGTDPISKAITAFRAFSAFGTVTLRASVKTRP